VIIVVSTLLAEVQAETDPIEPVHYAYANYLGSGIYRTTGQNASLVNLPFSYEIAQKDKTTYDLRLPLSLGFFDFELADIPELDLPDGVGTFTFTPGIEFRYQYNEDWLIESYIDLGYARNLTTDRGVTVHSAGVSALYSFNYQDYDSIWASRIYYASYSGNGYDAKDSYAAVHFGIDTGLPLQYQIFGYQFQPRVFATAFWYFSEVDFIVPLTQGVDENKNISLTNSVEAGFTLKFSKTIGYSWAGIERIGLSYRYSKELSAFRLLFSFPI